jgi:hypothetical protein
MPAQRVRWQSQRRAPHLSEWQHPGFHRCRPFRSGVLSYDPSTGRLLKASWLTEQGTHLFNDLVLADLIATPERTAPTTILSLHLP